MVTVTTKNLVTGLTIAILSAGVFMSCSREDVRPYVPTETFPNDTTLESISDKKAMVVIAHDDDMCAMSGTMSKLSREGWEIGIVSMSAGSERDAAQRKACESFSDTVIFINLSKKELRNDVDNPEPPYYAFPKDSFDLVFNVDIVAQMYAHEINTFDPTVIFTLDNKMGGYGHPEHVLVSQTVLDLAEDSLISPSYVYQSVLTDHMEKTIMARHSEKMKSWGFPGNEWDEAKKVYGVPDAMPEPSVQINIEAEAEQKMYYLTSYAERERKVIGFFIPAFEEYEAKEYFKLFDREFFHVIEF